MDVGSFLGLKLIMIYGGDSTDMFSLCYHSITALYFHTSQVNFTKANSL